MHGGARAAGERVGHRPPAISRTPSTRQRWLVSSLSDDAWLPPAEPNHSRCGVIYEAEQQNVQRAAIRLGIPRSSLYQKLARLGLLRKSRDAV